MRAYSGLRDDTFRLRRKRKVSSLFSLKMASLWNTSGTFQIRRSTTLDRLRVFRSGLLPVSFWFPCGTIRSLIDPCSKLVRIQVRTTTEQASNKHRIVRLPDQNETRTRVLQIPAPGYPAASRQAGRHGYLNAVDL
jgi:hypothetical protein